ncbi:MAG: deaminase [Sciscionella sp.]
MTELPPSAADLRHLRHAIRLADRCPRSDTAFSVGAVIVAADGKTLATGYSRESDPHEHAEEAALRKITSGAAELSDATLYSSLEPCSSRASRPRSCARHILDAGIGRIVFAWREPDLFVDCQGAETLRSAGREVIEVPELVAAAKAANAHLPGIGPGKAER